MFLKLALICLPPVVINSTATWTERDSEVVEEARVRCSKIYNDAPCLIKIEKTAEHSYRIMCGSMVEEDK